MTKDKQAVQVIIERPGELRENCGVSGVGRCGRACL